MIKDHFGYLDGEKNQDQLKDLVDQDQISQSCPNSGYGGTLQGSRSILDTNLSPLQGADIMDAGYVVATDDC